MLDLQSYAKEEITALIPEFDKLELRATVSDVSYSVEFFVWIEGEKKQCYELADEGIVEEEQLDQVLSRIAGYIRKTPDYKKGAVNKVAF